MFGKMVRSRKKEKDLRKMKNGQIRTLFLEQKAAPFSVQWVSFS